MHLTTLAYHHYSKYIIYIMVYAMGFDKYTMIYVYSGIIQIHFTTLKMPYATQIHLSLSSNSWKLLTILKLPW